MNESTGCCILSAWCVHKPDLVPKVTEPRMEEMDVTFDLGHNTSVNTHHVKQEADVRQIMTV